MQLSSLAVPAVTFPHTTAEPDGGRGQDDTQILKRGIQELLVWLDKDETLALVSVLVQCTTGRTTVRQERVLVFVICVEGGICES